MFNFFFINQVPIYVYREYTVVTVLQFSELIRITIPRFCFHDKLTIAGNCRMCLVELKGAIKPVISCGTNISAFMDIYTDTFFVKKARENVLEFLLINHPLDCPICDQAGECDLQDQSLMYGSDRGRFKEMKRSVDDKDFGPIIKTIMTRCIHCTRCIRYSDELAGVGNLGCIGRGSEMEIKMVLNNFFDSEVSGNLIDLCPVGALTSKPYAFSGRPWELQSVNTIDVLDSLHSNIRVDVKGNKIYRILPIQNELINEEWISDLTRFSHESIQTYRVKFPYVKFSEFFYFFLFFEKDINSRIRVRMSWDYLWLVISILFFRNKNCFDIYNFFLGNEVGLISSFFFFFIFHLSMDKRSFFFLENDFHHDIDNRSHFFFSHSLTKIMSNPFILLYDLDLKSSIPILNLRIKRYLTNTVSHKYMLYFGSNIRSTFSFYKGGYSIWSIFRLIRGSSLFCNILIRNQRFLKEKNGISVLSDSCKDQMIDTLNQSKIFDEVLSSRVISYSNLPGNYELGVKSSNITKLKLSDNLDLNQFFYFFKTNFNVGSNMVNEATSFSFYQGAQIPEKFDSMTENYIFFPSCSLFEHEDFYLNLFGYLQSSNQVVDLFENQEIYTDFYLMQQLIFFFLFRMYRNDQDKGSVYRFLRDYYNSYSHALYFIDYVCHDILFYYTSYFCFLFDSIHMLNQFYTGYYSHYCMDFFFRKNKTYFNKRPTFDHKNFFFVKYSSTLKKSYFQKLNFSSNFAF
uniref:NADH-ubiquinone oxidoreductase 75 kDa subunit n=1 Tax=Pleurostomum flabellatum TaxID=405751 RepID=A0A7T0M4Q2_9EUKA|nr:NADH-ubiquinone oxidoreductase 75 kDa subunit [Pleurostomum flabellatum]QPL15589.1 NADH-ubiquinone oxidoreductase 75 kDa subunit [Pleurostomum flabellatum]